MRILLRVSALLAFLLTASLVSAQAEEDPLILRLTDVMAPFAEGAQVHRPIQTAMLADSGASVFYEIAVSPDRCYSFVAVGEQTLEDLDLFLYAEGLELTAHTGVDNFPIVHWCNTVFDRVSVELRSYSGHGRFAFEALVHPSMPDGFDETLWAALNSLTGRYAEGARPARAPWMDVLPESRDRLFDVDLVPGRTYVVIAVGGPTVSDLDMLLLNDTGEEVDADLRTDPVAVLRYAVPPESDGRHHVRVVMTAGFGEFGVQVLVAD